MKRNRVYIDINSIVPLKSMGYLTGVGRTTFELIKEIDLIKDELPFDIVLYLQNIRGITPADFGISLPYKNLFLPSRDYINKFISPFHIRTALTKYDLWHCPHNSDYVDNVSKTIFTIHDLIFLTCEGEFPREAVERVQRELPLQLKQSKAVITCSQSTKKDMIKFFDIPADKIHVIYWGINHALFKPFENKKQIKEELNTKFGIDKPYFFSVSCGYGRKNTVKLLKAYHLLLEKNPLNDLIVIWKNYKDDVNELIQSSNGRICALSNISDEDLAKLYNGATATFYPSKYEGFGLPLLESMACGTPVVTCRNSSLEEIGGDIAIYVETEDTESILSVMESIENDKYDRKDIAVRGIIHALKFTWKECAKQTIAVYNKYLYE